MEGGRLMRISGTTLLAWALAGFLVSGCIERLPVEYDVGTDAVEDVRVDAADKTDLPRVDVADVVDITQDTTDVSDVGDVPPDTPFAPEIEELFDAVEEVEIGQDEVEIEVADLVEPDVPPIEPGTIVECAELEPPAEGTCTVETGDDALLVRGTILAPAAIYEGGEILLSDQGEILCVGCDCSLSDEAAEATVIACAKGVVSPGLINAHDHLTYTQNFPGDWGTERYEHRHDWRKGIRGHTKIPYSGGANQKQVTWGEMRQVLSGTTSIAGSGKAMGFLRNLDKTAQEGLNQDPVYYNTFPLGDSGGMLLAEGCDYPGIDGKWVLDTDCYIPHVAEGIDKETRNEFICLSNDANGGIDLTEPNSVFIHGVGLKAMDGAELAANSTAIVWSPRTNISLYGNTAPVTMYDRQGVLLALGTDWTPSGSINMQRELQCAAYMNDYHYDGYFSSRDLWLMATTYAATALAVDDAVGLLKPGLAGDVAIYRNNGATDYYRAIIDSNVEDTVLVLRSGFPLYGDADVMGAIPKGQEECEEIPGGVCGIQKTICTERETGMSFSLLQSSNSGSYGLFFCDTPPGEPTCVPMRPGEYTGESNPDDSDGDGIVNDEDNCPDVFNPVRPLDGDSQADHDFDGTGDMCDPCPMDADTEECSPPDPNDKDADGIVNYEDNCPVEYNPEQTDTDEDGMGDLCDPCPEYANPENSACPGTIYDVKTGAMPVGSKVLLEGVVTGVADPRFFIQVPEELQDDELGCQFSGIYVYVPTGNPGELTIPKRGDYVMIAAKVVDWYGQLQLNYIQTLEIVESDVALPQPVEVLTADVGAGGELADAYEAVLVTVTDGMVSELNPPAGPGDEDPTNEYVLDGVLTVNDFMFLTDPFPVLDDVLTVTGVLRWSNNDSKLEPREEEDVIRVLKLREFDPGLIYINEGEIEAATVPPLTVELTAAAPEGGIVVALASSDIERLTVPETVTVEEGLKSAPVSVTAILGSAETVVVTAALNDQEVQVEVLVIPPDQVPIPILLTPENPAISVEGELEMTVTLDIPGRPGGTLVNLTTDEAGISVLEYPEAVTVEEGAFFTSFTVAGLLPGSATLTASTEAGEVSTELEIVEVQLAGLIITEILYDTPGGDSPKEWVEIYNGTIVEVDLSAYSLGNGGTNYTTSKVQLSGIVEPGACFVVGGPESGEDNGSPVFDQEFDFEPDFQNSGDTADGVALFAVPASEVTNTTVPIDVVIYGGQNKNGLMDETGEPGEVDVGDVSSGSSLELTADGWVAQPEPTPNDCAAAIAP